MRKICSLILLFFACYQFTNAQCTSSIASGQSGATVSTCGVNQSITIPPTSWGTIGTLTNGWTYTVTSTNGAFITVRQNNGTGTVIGSGNTALTFTSNFTGTAAVMVYQTNSCTNVWNGSSSIISYTVTNPVASSVSVASNSCGTLTLQRTGGNGTIQWEQSTDGISWTPTGNFGTTFGITNSNTNRYFSVLNSSGPCSVRSNILDVNSLIGSGIVPPYYTGNLTLTSNVTMGGNYVITGDFTLNAGVTIFEQAGCDLSISANNITINGTIDGVNRGLAGGSGGGYGQLWSEDGSSDGRGITYCWDKDNCRELRLYGGNGGGAGVGAGAGSGGGTAAYKMGVKQECNNWDDDGGRVAGAGGAGGGKGGGYGGNGGNAAVGGRGGDETGCRTASCRSTNDVGGTGGAGSTTGGGTYDNATAYTVFMGSGGGGAGGGGRGAGGTTASGAAGGNGGGSISLKSSVNLTLGASAVISANGGNGGNGGKGGDSYNTGECCGDLSGGCDEVTFSGSGGGGAGAGGGAGGGVLLSAFGNMNLTSGSKLNAIGGNGGNGGNGGYGAYFNNATAGGSGGGGGGGRIKIFINPCANNTLASTNTYDGGTGAANGTRGTYSVNSHPNYTPLVAGTAASSQTVSVGQIPTNITASTPTGGTGNYVYEWFQSTTNCGASFTSGSSTPPSGWNSTGITSSSYPFNASLCQTTCYVRRVQSGNCYEWTNSVTITVSPLAAPTLTAATSVGCGGFTINWNAVSGASHYYIDIATDIAFTNYVNANQYFNNFNAGNVTTYPVTGLSSTTTYYIRIRTGNTSCSLTSGNSATQTVTTLTTPVAYAGTDITTCTGTSAITMTGATASGSYSGTPTWSGGSGFGTWSQNANPALATFIPSAASGLFTATLTLTGQSGCANATATRVITWGTQPTVSAGSNYAGCSGTSPIPMTGATATGTYSAATWSGGSLLGNWSQNIDPALATFTPSVASGSFTATITLTGANGCGNATATKTITWQTAIAGNTITAPAVTVFCGSGDPSSIIGSVAPTLNGGNGTYGFQWQEKINSGSWVNISSANAADFNPPLLSSDTHSYRRVVDAGLCADTSNLVTIIIELPISNNVITNTGVSAFCQSGDPALFTGSIPTTPSSSFTYQWQSSVDGGLTWSDISLANAQDFNPILITQTTSYKRRVRSSSCEDFSNIITITIHPIATITQVSSTPVLCFGGNTGSITISANGGTPPLQFSVDSGNTFVAGNVFNGLTAGTYHAVLTDANGCNVFYSMPVVITEPPLLTLGITGTDASCSNVFDGTITATAGGGLGTYSYSLNGGPNQPSNIFNNVGAGFYTVVVTDGNACTASDTITINNQYAITATLDSVKAVSCFGGTDGEVYVTLSGGVPAYSYSINGITFQPLPYFTGLTANNYVVTLRDSKGCTAFLNANVTQPALLTVLVDSVVNSLCNGGSTGGIYISAGGGTAPYSYVWSNGSTNQDLTNVSANTYNVTITDAKGCTAVGGAAINEPLPLFAQIAASSDVLCNGDSSGYVDISVAGGVPPYSFIWSDGSTLEDIHNIPTGNYSVTVTDKNSCSVVINKFIGEPQLLAASATATNVQCNGGNTGGADLTVTGGVIPYSFLWSNGQTTEDLSNVAAGLYTVVATDKNGCSVSVAVTITEPAPITFTITKQDVSCNDDSTGSITLTVNGGTAPISFVWNDGDLNQNRTNLSAGVYSVTINDVNNCGATTSVTITEPAAMVMTETVTDVNCFGGNSGSIYPTVNGGVFPYSYAWSNGANTQNISGLAGGNYTVTVTDANSCTLIRTFTVNSPTAPIATTTTGSNLSCFGDANGSASVTVLGGTAPYSFLWNNFANTSSINGLSGGKYTVLVTDANGCTARDSVFVTEPAQLVVTTTSVNILCNGNLGTITANVVGGTPTYTYAWSNGDSSTTITANAGSYTVTVTDGNGCTSTASATLSQPTSMAVNGVVKHVSCAGTADGGVTLNIFGGVGPYDYLWSNGDTTKDVSGLAGNNYSVTVTDNNGCTSVSLFIVNEPTALFASIVKTDVNCPGAANGTATVTASGGTAPYTYAWSNFNIAPNVTGLSGGKYFVVVRDKNNCEVRDSVEILEPQPIVITETITNVSCNGANDGSISIAVVGGTPNYTYLWSNGNSTNTISNLAAGQYSLTITDANNCTKVETYMVTQPQILSLNGIEIDANCFGSPTGKVDVTVVGGTVPYTFAWSNGAITEDLNNVIAGTYDVTVTDGAGCTATDTYTVGEPTAITSSVLVTDVTCAGAKNGAVDLSIQGGTAPYTYLWSTFQASQDISNLNGGLFIVIVTDAKGCQHRDSANVFEPLPIVLTTTVTQISCFNANDGTITVNVTGGTPGYTYVWNNGGSSATVSNLAGNTYAVTVTDAQGCTAATSAQIINPSKLNINAIVNTPKCSGDSNGSIDLIVSGGTPGYAYAWSNGSNLEDLSSIASGIYIVTVTDSRACSAVDSVDVSQPSPLYQTGIITDVTCAGASDGVIINTAYGGTLPYTYEWNDGSVNKDRGSLQGGAYRVTVTDGNGCTATGVYNVFEPQPLVAQLQKTDAICFGSATGSVAPIVTGGTYPYYYLWSNFAVDSAQNGVTAGVYSVVVTDKHNCRAVDTITINQPAEIIIAGVVTDAKCKGVANGSVVVNVTGGTGTYTYAWSNSTSNQNLTNVGVGSYTLTVTDASGCTKTAIFNVGEQQQLFVSIASIAEPACYAGDNGAVDITVAGGTLPYTYVWSNGSTFEDILNLKQGSYTVTITDANGCIGNITAQVNEPDSMHITTSAIGSKCVNAANGKVTVNVTGGTSPYIYTLNGIVQAANEFSGLLPGTYTVLVRDYKGCENTSTFTVVSPSDITVDLTADKVVILSGMDVQLDAVTTSTKTVVNHYWSPLNVMNFVDCADAANCSSPKAAPQITTIFMVTVMDEDSCTASDTVRVEVKNEESNFIPSAFSPNGDGLNDRFEFDILGAVNADVKIYDRWGNLIFTNANQKNGIGNNDGWDGTFKGKTVELDTYVYIMKVKYFNGVEKDFRGTISIMK